MSNPMEVDSDTPPSQLLRPAFIPTPPAVSSLQDKINLTMNDTNWSNKMKRAGNDPKMRVEVFGFIMIALVHAATSEANFIELASARAAEKLIEGLDEKELKEWEDRVGEGIQNRDWARLASHRMFCGTVSGGLVRFISSQRYSGSLPPRRSPVRIYYHIIVGAILIISVACPVDLLPHLRMLIHFYSPCTNCPQFLQDYLGTRHAKLRRHLRYSKSKRCSH